MKAHLLLFGLIPLVVHAERTAPNRVQLPIAAHSLLVHFDERAEEFANLVVFEGYLLRDGLPGGSKLLDFEHGGVLYHPGDYTVKKKVTRGKVKVHDKTTGKGRDQDEVDFDDGVAEIWYGLHALQFPRARGGSRGLIMRPKPLSFERDYLRIVSTEAAVLFESCVTF